MCSLKMPVIYFPTKTNTLKSVMSQSVVLCYIVCTVQYSTVYLFCGYIFLYTIFCDIK